MSHRFGSGALIVLGIVALVASLPAQSASLSHKSPRYELPDRLRAQLSPEDQELFTRLLNMNIESGWSYMRTRGYPRNFISDVRPVAPEMRFAGRARTMRYLPYRKDLREKFEGLRLHFRSAEDTEPGDVLVFDCGGELEASPSGDVTSTRAMVRGAAGVVVDGAMRDVPAFVEMGLPLFTRDGRGHAASISPLTMAWDYQVPVRIGDVTVAPGVVSPRTLTTRGPGGTLVPSGGAVCTTSSGRLPSCSISWAIASRTASNRLGSRV